MRILLSILTLALILIACKSTDTGKNILPDQRPDWVTARPVSGQDYIGIGVASKITNPIDYQKVAKKNALEDLAGEISVVLDANSMLYQLDRSNGFTEEYSSTIKVSTREKLEGYDIVDSWENNNEFWILYRLSKSKHEQIQREKRAKAISQARDLYNTAIQFRATLDYDMAFSNLIKAFEVVEDYLSESMEIVTENGTEYFGNTLFNFYLELINDIELEPKAAQMAIVRGVKNGNDQVVVLAENREGRNIRRIPIRFGYSESKRKFPAVFTDQSGLAFFALPKIVGEKSIQYITAELDLELVVGNATDHEILRNLLTRPETPKARIRLDISQPTFYISSTELMFGESMSQMVLQRAMQNELIKRNLQPTDSAKADYIFRINTDVSNGGQSFNFYTAFLKGDIQVSREGKIVHNYSFKNVKGVHLELQRAGQDAYKEAEQEMQYQAVPSILEVLLD
jgi:CBS domain-containing protein